jgi:hypothetical protein
MHGNVLVCTAVNKKCQEKEIVGEKCVVWRKIGVEKNSFFVK